MKLPIGYVVVCSSLAAVSGAHAQSLQFKTASSHPMQYYLALPDGWTASKKWPVVLVIESANKEFESTAQIFVRARHDLPFIVVAPLVITNGGPRYREAPTYRYTEAVWNQVEQVGRCRFDMDGIAAVAGDVRKLYGGESQYFITGWEAGGHTVWALLFQHPEALRAAAPVCPNYAGRCMEDGQYSSEPSRTQLPVKIFGGDSDPAWKPGQPLFVQSADAKRVAAEHGYRNISEALAPGGTHGPLADRVLAYFYSEWKH